jgi:hypothetical protein
MNSNLDVLIMEDKKKLISKSVQKANEQLWTKHPELLGRQLTVAPADKKYRAEWVKMYREAKNEDKKSEKNNTIQKSVILPCNRNNSPLIPAAIKPSVAEQDKCKFNAVSVEKPSRKYTLKLLPNQSPSLPTVLEVVGGIKNKPAEISVKVNELIQAGNNCIHQNNTFNYFLDKDELKGDPSNSELDFMAFAPSHSSYKIWSIQPNLYQFNVSTCGAKVSATIAVYVDSKYNISIEFPQPQYKNENKLTPKNNFDSIEIENKKSLEWGVALTGSIESDGLKREIELEFKDEIERIKQISTISKGLQNHLAILKNGGKVEPISFVIKFPNLKFSYKGNWQEKDASPLCDFENELSIRFDPLIGIDVNVDLIATTAVAFGGPFGKILLYVRKFSQKNVDIQFNFVLSGEGGGGWTGKYSKNEKKWNSSDRDITVLIGAKLEAKASYKMDIILLFIGAGSISGGIEGMSKGELEFKGVVDQESKLTVTAKHNGLKFKGCVYIAGGWKNIAQMEEDEADSEKEPAERSAKASVEVEIVAPQEDPLVLYSSS